MRCVALGRPASRVVAVQQTAERAEDRALAAATAAGLRRRRVDASSQAAERQRLQPHASRSAHRREEETLAAEERRLDAAHHLDVVAHRRLHTDEAAGVDAQDLARTQVALHERAAGVDEAPAVALQTLHDEALAAEQADAELALERDADRHTLGGDQERVLLADDLAAHLGQVRGHDLARDGGAEGDAALAAALVLEHGHEQRLAGQQALAGAHERAHDARLLLLRTVAEDGLHRDAVVHVHHAAGFGDDRFLRIQLDLDELHVVAEDLVIDLVHPSHVASSSSASRERQRASVGPPGRSAPMLRGRPGRRNRRSPDAARAMPGTAQTVGPPGTMPGGPGRIGGRAPRYDYFVAVGVAVVIDAGTAVSAAKSFSYWSTTSFFGEDTNTRTPFETFAMSTLQFWFVAIFCVMPQQNLSAWPSALA